ncbi:MAG: DUF364 domain-containing protein [Bacteroidales bacterium]|nr:DUF364 domain-containing protein [Bacteroidales bacterium]
MILRETVSLLKENYKAMLEDLTIVEVVSGIFLTAVRLSDNSCGVASTMTDNFRCSKDKRDFGDFTPLKIRGQRVLDLFETNRESGAISTLRIAVLNAISSRLISDQTYRILSNTDPIDLIRPEPGKTITLVGAFQSYIGRIAESGAKLRVLEMDEKALSGGQEKFYVPAEEFKKIIPESDIVIITGMTLVNDTIDDLLAYVSRGSKVIVTGPSGSIIPDLLFKYNVSIIGATRITNPALLFQIAGEWGAGYHLFRYCAEKICILRHEQQ